jgi:hypothetical protein
MTKLSGGLNNWYVVPVKNPQRKEQEPYQAECEDIIQALGMTFDEGCAFKALWRNAAARMGNGKPGNTAVYDAEKLVHYANRVLAKERVAAIVEPLMFQGNKVTNGSKYGVYLEPKSGDGSRPVSDKARDDGWVYHNCQPAVTQPYRDIEVAYRNGKRRTYFSINDVKWAMVYKYRINYS